MTKEFIVINILLMSGGVFLIGEELGYSSAFGMLLLAIYVRIKTAYEFDKLTGKLK